jgi:flagellar biosynthesis/type III secretory pathway M-ring protein FliF/YscJ
VTRRLPAPRPALHRADDGTVEPAATFVSALKVDLALGRPDDKKAKKKDHDIVELPVELPKRTRKRLRKKAATFDWTAEEATAQLIRAWLDEG